MEINKAWHPSPVGTRGAPVPAALPRCPALAPGPRGGGGDAPAAAARAAPGLRVDLGCALSSPLACIYYV